MILDELIALLGYKIEGEEDLKKFNKSLDQLEKKAEKVGKAIGTMAVATAAAATAAFAFLGKSVIETTAQFEAYEATLTTIEGSSEKAKTSLAWISDFAKTTPYDVAGVTEAFVKLKAYGLDPMDGTLTALGDASSAMGKPLMQSVEAIADAVTGENERLKEFGIKASNAGDMVTYTWRQNGKEMTKTMKKNGIEIAKFLRDNFEGRFAGAMVRQSKTWNGMVSNLGDTWTNFQRQIGEAGFFDAVKGQLGRLMDYLGEQQANGNIQKWAKRLSDGFIVATNAAAATVENIIGHFNAISTWIDNHPDLFGKIKIALFALGAIRFPKTFALIALDEILSTLEGKDTVLSRLANAISDFTGIDAEKLKIIVSTLAGMAVFATIAGGVGSLATGIIGLTTALTGLGTSAGAASGLAMLTRLGGAAALAVGGGAWLINKGKEHIMSQPGAAEKYSPEANKKEIKDRHDRLVNWWNSWFDGSRSEGTGLTAAQAASNAQSNAAKMGGDKGAANVTQTDNSNRSVTNNINTTVNQTVQQATQAPGAAASATAAEVNKAAQPARMQGNAGGGGAF